MINKDGTMSGHRLHLLLASGYVLLIYASSGRMRDLSNLARRLFGESLNLLMTLGLLLVLAGILLAARHLLDRRRVLPLLPILLAYGIVLWWLKIPEERFHLLQYGVLCFLGNKALPETIQGYSRYLLVLSLVTLAGIGDEIIQWLRPNRVGDVRDVLINFIAALLAQALIMILSRKSREKTDLQTSGVQSNSVDHQSSIL